MSKPSLEPLTELPGVTEAVTQARAAVDDVHEHPMNRRGWPTTAAEASVRAARASAAVAGGAAEIPESGSVDEPLLAGALRVAEALGTMLPTWQRAPLQTLARMHVLAASDLVTDSEELGRPRVATDVSERLDVLSEILTDSDAQGPGPVLAAVVHGELLALDAFGSTTGVIARAAARLCVIGTGLDPKGLVVPEVAYFRNGEEYAEKARGFATGDPNGVAEWIQYCCRSLESGAREARSIADAATPE